jgi:hypothetical protein
MALCLVALMSRTRRKEAREKEATLNRYSE